MAEIESFADYEIEGLPRTEANLKWLWSHFECARCGQCCRIHEKGVRITRAEAEALAAKDGLSIEDYLRTLRQAEDTFLLPQPWLY
jgi:hypothetical protein